MKIQTKTIAYTAMMTAIVFVCTSFLGVNMGTTYTNLGDAMIFLSAALLGPLPAMLAGGIGSFFADMLVFPLTMWCTLVIKGLEGLVCGLLMKLFSKLPLKKMLSALFSVMAMLVAGLWMMAGYFAAETLIYGTYAGALFALPANAVQVALSIVVAVILIYGFNLCKLLLKQKNG